MCPFSTRFDGYSSDIATQLIGDKAIATSLRRQIARRMIKHHQQGLRVPGLAATLVGTDPASQVCVAYKRKDHEGVDFPSQACDLPTETSQDDLLALIDRPSNGPVVGGILTQLPLPAHLDASLLLERIHPDRDVGGFHPYNIGRPARRMPLLRLYTLKGIMTLLASTGTGLYGMGAVVVSTSDIVGRPMALELLLSGCTVTVIHRFTHGLADHMSRADPVMVAADRPGLARGERIKEGTIIIDTGINRQTDSRLIGDVEYRMTVQCTSWITPVPGGVGPMIRTCLLENTLHAVEHLHD